MNFRIRITPFKSFSLKWLFLWGGLLIAGACTPSSENTAESSVSSTTEPKDLGTDCLYCRMPSEEFPNFKVKIISERGAGWFCSPRCMFFVVKDSEQTPKDIQLLEVRDYYDTKALQARTAYYVQGSDVIGPMGHDLIPHATEEAAREFSKEHQGKEILGFKDINKNTLQKLLNPE